MSERGAGGAPKKRAARDTTALGQFSGPGRFGAIIPKNNPGTQIEDQEESWQRGWR
jgi:hypothetical protein